MHSEACPGCGSTDVVSSDEIYVCEGCLKVWKPGDEAFPDL